MSVKDLSAAIIGAVEGFQLDAKLGHTVHVRLQQSGPSFGTSLSDALAKYVSKKRAAEARIPDKSALVLFTFVNDIVRETCALLDEKGAKPKKFRFLERWHAFALSFVYTRRVALQETLAKLLPILMQRDEGFADTVIAGQLFRRNLEAQKGVGGVGAELHLSEPHTETMVVHLLQEFLTVSQDGFIRVFAKHLVQHSTRLKTMEILLELMCRKDSFVAKLGPTRLYDVLLTSIVSFPTTRRPVHEESQHDGDSPRLAGTHSAPDVRSPPPVKEATAENATEAIRNVEGWVMGLWLIIMLLPYNLHRVEKDLSSLARILIHACAMCGS